MTESVPTHLDRPVDRPGPDRQIAWWLLVCCALIFAMVVLGGVTRLTGSGLSMVNWKPVSGVLPPLSQEAWEAEFENYRQTPEYTYVNKGMSLEAFKGIFWFEYAHRVLGRLIGIAFLLPFLYFLMRRRIEPALVPKLVVMFVLGGLQGLLGWYMVKSGLVDDPHVSQYRLAAHLGLAVIIYAYMLWTALGILRDASGRGPTTEGRGLSAAMVLAGVVFLTMMTGAFVAGLKAGFIYNTFPKMGEGWIPAGMWAISPAYLNLFENPGTVQFVHRIAAIATFLAIVALWVRDLRRHPPRRERLWLHLVAGTAVVQVALGISTLVLMVPVSLAALHQAGAMVLLTALLCLAHETRGRVTT